jgi:DNA helicase-2/ATP-dependent DNA helicase PcrA
VKEINKMIDAGTIHPGSTVALIYRTNAQSRALEEACVANNLQYLVRGSAGTFYSRAEIKDCLCFLRWIYNGRDRSAMLRAIKTPSRGLGDVSMNEFSAYCNEVENQLQNEDIAIPTTPLDILLSLADSPDNSPYIPPDGMISKRTMNRLVPFASQMKKLKEKAEIQTVAELLGTIIESLNLKSHFDSISKTSEEFADRWANVNELRSASERYSADGSCLNKKKVQEDDDTQVTEMSPLGNFLDDVSLLTDVEGSSEDDEESGERRLVANLMTIHASKVKSLFLYAKCPIISLYFQFNIFPCFNAFVYHFNLITREWNLIVYFWLGMKK